MATRATTAIVERRPLSRERVLAAAISIADKGGIASLSMRKLAHELQVEPMSLYYYFKSKDDMLDGLVDIVVSQFELPSGGTDWKARSVERDLRARRLKLHPWACGL